jgi:phosphatidylserine decarboxylase
MSVSLSEKSPEYSPVEIAGRGAFPLCLEGLPYIVGALIVAGLITVFLSYWIALPIYAFAAFAAWFFRNPTRSTPADTDAVISPADGVICMVSDVEEKEWLAAPAKRVSIFMSVVNVHVNRAPVAGRVVATKHTPGKFSIASADKASTDNERNAIVLETPKGKKLLFVQIAGSIARRIVCYAKAEDRLAAGQRFGLIRFGSRVDVYFPAGSTVGVKVGDRVVGGETILGRLA